MGIDGMRATKLLVEGLIVLGLVVSAVAVNAEDDPNATVVPTKQSEEQLAEELGELERRLRELQATRDREIEELSRRLAELEQALERLQEARQLDELEAIRAEAEELTADEAKKEQEAEADRETFVGRQRNLQALNPEISFLGDVSYEWSESGDIQNRFVLRGAEIGFQSTLDPYTRFKAFLAAHQEPPLYECHHDHEGKQEEEHAHEHADEISVTVEELYAEWVALPANMSLRVGKFRQRFGTLNRWHPHALPTVDLPFALRNLFGHDGLVGLGVGADWQLPRLWASSNGLTVEIVNADNPLAFAGSHFDDPTFLLRHTGFFDLGPDSYFELGLNGIIGPNGETESSNTSVASIDFNFLWEPVQRARYRGLELRGEYIHSRYETDGEPVMSDSFYAYLSWRLGRRLIIGLRYDNAELPYPDTALCHEQAFEEGLGERAWSPYLTFWQSEFVRLRAQFQHATRDFEWEWGPEEDNRLYLQVTFAAGPHKHEAY